MIKKLSIITLLSLTLALTACGDESLNVTPNLEMETVPDIVGDDLFSSRDLRTEIDLTDAIYITLNNEDLEITEEGIYVLSGSIDDGQIKINATSDDKIQLILDNVTISNSEDSAIYVKKADKVFITLKEDTINTITSLSLTDEDRDGAIYSKDDITFNGYGTLNVNSDEHGIVGNDDLVLAQATYNINAGKRGLDANDSIRIYDGTYNITSGKDAIKADEEEDPTKGYIYVNDGTFTIDSVEDGFASSGLLQIIDGTFDITTGGGFVEVLNDLTVGEGSGGVTQPTDLLPYTMQSMRCNGIIISGGTFTMSSYEDAIHSNGNLLIEGGDLTIISGDDAVHADDQIVITNGNIKVTNCYEGIEADFVTISGGNIHITGYDDGINVGSEDGLLTISGGTIYVTTKGDCIDSNGDFLMTGGHVTLVSEAIYTMGDGAVDVTGNISFTGGTLVDGDGKDIDPDASANTNSNRPGRL